MILDDHRCIDEKCITTFIVMTLYYLQDLIQN